ncbi:Aste57867_10015 [Aphanomyces stellatus]|uniref:Aste57867_10015 protein n=1 Tax=Aphanomyces stellatus TaxID=120398 RepID=A0A485KPZ6_9STRA|nr:hypothetical protein As57867_009976 [Aphanomyces stellatus]VFT86893.1 Aste57867_10015 [Aphanomyces stellatus]
MICRQGGLLRAVPSPSPPSARGKVVPQAKETLTREGIPHLQRLLSGVEDNSSFILLVDNDATSASLIVAACILKKVCILIPAAQKDQLLPYVVENTGLSLVVNPHSGHTKMDRLKESPRVWLDDPRLLDGGVCMLTSGSTGLPKIVCCTWASMLLQGDATQRELFPDGPCRFICASSIAHAYAINALFAIYMSPFGHLSDLHLDLDLDLASNSSSATTILFGTPGSYIRFLSDESADTSLAHVQAFSAGVSLPRPLGTLLLERFGLRVMQNYGSTETGGIAFGGTFEKKERESSLPCAGAPWPGVQVRFDRPATGRVCGAGEWGEIVVLTPWQCTGYVVGRSLVPISTTGFYHTGDGGALHETGTLRLGQRLREPVCFRHEGLDIFVPPQQVESALLKNPHVTDVLVPLVLCKEKTKPVALVVAPNSTMEEIDQWCRKHLPPMLQDLDVRLMEYLPCSPAGKLMYSIPS